MQPNGVAHEPPIAWPHIVIDGVDIELKYGLGLFYKASKAGVNIADLADRAKNFGVVMDLVALLAEPALKNLGRPVLTGEQWADKLVGFDQYPEIAKALNEAYQLSVKMRPVVSAPTPQEPASEPMPN